MSGPDALVKVETTLPPLAPQGNVPSIVPATSAEGYKFYEKLVDADVLYLNKLTRLLYSSVLIKTDTLDPTSPIPGFALQHVAVKGTDGKEVYWSSAMNFQGYQMVANDYLFAVSEVMSTTNLPDEFQLSKFTVSKVMSIIDMIVANRRAWEFNTPNLILSLGLDMWYNILGVASRSYTGGKAGRRNMLDRLLHPAVFGAQNAPQEQERSAVKKLLW